MADVELRLLQIGISGRLILVRSSGFCEMGRVAMLCRPFLIYRNSNDGRSLHISTACPFNKLPMKSGAEAHFVPPDRVRIKGAQKRG